MSDGTGRLFKRGNIWWIDYGFRGKRYRESSKSTKKGDARDLLKERIEETRHGGPKVDEDSVTFADLREAVVNDYEVNDRKSLSRVERAFDHLEEVFGGCQAVNITTSSVERYKKNRKADGAANATINKEMAALRRAFNLLVEREELSTMPTVKSLETNNTRRRFLTMADVDAICQEISDDLAPVVRFAALTGWRKGEVLGLRWRNVSFDDGTVHLDPGTTKNDEGRTFPFAIVPPLRELLQEQRERTKAVERRKGEIVPHVFHRDGKPIKSMRGAWNGACDRAGLEGSWFHDLRRTAVRALEASGVSRSIAMSFTGHLTESVYSRYAIEDKTAQEEGAEKYAQYLEEQKGGDDRTAVPLDAARRAE